MKQVEVLTYSGVDSVGQKRMGEPTTRTVDMFFNPSAPRYLVVFMKKNNG